MICLRLLKTMNKKHQNFQTHNENATVSTFQRLKAKGITVRQPKINTKTIPRYFMGNSPLISYFFTALSLTFPEGEQFFVHSVRNVRDRVKNDEQLQAKISAFIGQEAMHANLHDTFNKDWRTDTYNLDAYTRLITKSIRHMKGQPAIAQLALTSAFEHFNAIFATYILNNHGLIEKSDPEAMKFWLWHAIEEIEHKSVAFDTYKTTFNNEKVRLATMKHAMAYFIGASLYGGGHLFLKDLSNNWKYPVKNLKGLLFVVDILRSSIPELNDYFKPDFHPDQTDQSELIAYWKNKLATEYGMPEFTQVA